MTRITFSTPRGAEITIDSVHFSASVNGKEHTMASAKFVENDAEAGPHILLAGKVKAQIPADRVDEVAAWYTAANKANAEWVAEEGKKAAREFYVENRMRDMGSRYSAN